MQDKEIALMMLGKAWVFLQTYVSWYLGTVAHVLIVKYLELIGVREKKINTKMRWFVIIALSFILSVIARIIALAYFDLRGIEVKIFFVDGLQVIAAVLGIMGMILLSKKLIGGAELYFKKRILNDRGNSYHRDDTHDYNDEYGDYPEVPKKGDYEDYER